MNALIMHYRLDLHRKSYLYFFNVLFYFNIYYITYMCPINAFVLITVECCALKFQKRREQA